MAEHHLKIRPEFFESVLNGEKTFELRYDDRGFKAGDILILREWYRDGNYYSGREIRKKVTYLLGGLGLEKGHVCMALGEET